MDGASAGRRTPTRRCCAARCAPPARSRSSTTVWSNWSRCAHGGAGRLALAGGTIAERTPNALYFLPPRAEIPAAAALPDAGTARLDGAGVLRVKPCRAQPVRGEPLRQALRRDALPGAVVRTRRAGDRIRPLGTGEKLLSDVLTDRGVDRPLRDFWPLVARGNRVLWAVGLCISADAALRPGDAAAELCWQPDAWARPLFTTAQTTMDDGGE